MFDLKTMRLALIQLEEERKIPKDKIIEAIEQSLAAAYKKDYGKKGQIVRCHFDMDSGETVFSQVKIVVDDTLVRIVEEGEENETPAEEGDERVRYNEEHHIFVADAKKIKKDAELEDEIIFPLENKADFGRVAAQTAKQVIIQKIREAERSTIIDEYGDKEGEIVNGYVQKTEKGMLFVDFNRATGVLSPEEQIPNERWNRGDRIRAYLFSVEESVRGVNLRLSRTHPKFLHALFEIEAPEIAAGTVEIKSIAREPGSRSKIAVHSNDDQIDPIGACVGGRGVRVTTVSNELNGEKIDIIPWSENPAEFISNSLSPAKVINIEIDETEHKASVEVAEDQLSLAIGKGGQNVRLAAKLTGWRIDIKGTVGDVVVDETVMASDEREEKAKEKDIKKEMIDEANKENLSEAVTEALEEAKEEGLSKEDVEKVAKATETNE